MRLESFRIINYKSIIDSGVCRLSDTENILILAGQNESGKSAILEALFDFESGELSTEALRDFEEPIKYPEISCTYHPHRDEDIGTRIKEQMDIPAILINHMNSWDSITLTRRFDSSKTSILTVSDEITAKIDALIDRYNDDVKKNLSRPSNSDGANQPNNLPEEGAQNETTDDKHEEEDELSIDMEMLADLIWRQAPSIIHFADLQDILPSRIYIADLKSENDSANGYNAVKNLETILNVDFTFLADCGEAQLEALIDRYGKVTTLHFNRHWKQRHQEGNEPKICVRYKQGGSDDKGSYLNFFVITKDGEYLPPSRRSKGFIWFLSFFLELVAESKSHRDLVILFDEPGLYLHAKAQEDIKSLFDELSEKHQIIYSTHSPYLLDAKYITSRVKLVINDPVNGTTIEKITTKKVRNQKDALRPIIDALGLNVAHEFTPLSQNNVIVEGISDFNYFLAMNTILDMDDTYSFVPSQGASNMHLLMELCIGWGLNWMLIFDDGQGSKSARNKIKAKYFDGDEERFRQFAITVPDCDHIEDAFDYKDLNQISSNGLFKKTTANSKIVKELGNKELISRLFLEKVRSGDITRKSLQPTTISRFQELFKSIDERLSNG